MSRDPKYSVPEFAPESVHPDCALRNRVHAAHELGSPGGNKIGSRCDGNPAPECDECAEPIDETDPAPSCGAHRLHLDCRGHFDCRWCDEEWEDANS